jgi:hypothetical protein
MGEVIPTAPAAGNKARPSLSKEESARFFGPPPLIAGEDQAQYEAMRDQISAAVGPLDFLEEIWVNDVVNLVWETQRLRRLKANFLKADAARGVHRILTMESTWSTRNLAMNWAAREPDAVAKVDAALAAAGLTIDAVMAETLAVNIDKFERIDRLVASAEARRNVALREIDRHRATLGAALRQAADEALDVEFKEIPPSLTEGEAA